MIELIVLIVLAVLAVLVLGSVISVALNIFGLLLAVLLWMFVGYLAGQIVRGKGYGPIGDAALGLVGGIVGSILLGILGINIGGLLGAIVTGVVGGVVVVGAAHALTK